MVRMRRLLHSKVPSLINLTADTCWIGDSGVNKVALYVVSTMWNLQVTVFNSKTDEEYRVQT